MTALSGVPVMVTVVLVPVAVTFTPVPTKFIEVALPVNKLPSS
jgi:hypothetical protein